jgi:hypothetical protein
MTMGARCQSQKATPAAATNSTETITAKIASHGDLRGGGGGGACRKGSWMGGWPRVSQMEPTSRGPLLHEKRFGVPADSEGPTGGSFTRRS